MSKKLTTSEFIIRCNLVHQNKYDYSTSVYTKNSEKIEIRCDIHGLFIQTAAHHMNGSGCNKCTTRRKKKSSSSFVEESILIHNKNYNYSLVDYKGSHIPVIIICKKHGEFSQIPTNHLSGKGCSRCAYDNNKVSNFFENVNLIHDSKYTYFNDYINLRSKIKIMCEKHGIFTQRAKNHIDGQGCPTCGDKFGIKENKWLDSLNIVKRQVRIGKYIVDGYDDKTNTKIRQSYGQ